MAEGTNSGGDNEKRLHRDILMRTVEAEMRKALDIRKELLHTVLRLTDAIVWKGPDGRAGMPDTIQQNYKEFSQKYKQFV